MLPDSYEVDLIRMQYKFGVSLFACDEHEVYSSRPVPYATGRTSAVVQSDLRCELGGEFYTRLNAGIFRVVWRKVLTDDRFRHYDWTVKVDPDSVFFPNRLRGLLKQTIDHIPRDGMYLNNCKFGLHGPLEMLSRVAVLRWVVGMDGCEAHFRREACKGQPCAWGEDLAMDQCMWKILKVKRLNISLLLNEAHCDSKDWSDCSNGAVAFHPFKTAGEYGHCLTNAEHTAVG
jgi:hypothetical protein